MSSLSVVIFVIASAIIVAPSAASADHQHCVFIATNLNYGDHPSQTLYFSWDNDITAGTIDHDGSCSSTSYSTHRETFWDDYWNPIHYNYCGYDSDAGTIDPNYDPMSPNSQSRFRINISMDGTKEPFIGVLASNYSGAAGNTAIASFAAVLVGNTSTWIYGTGTVTCQ